MVTKDITLNDKVFVFETVMRIRNTEVDIGQYLSFEAFSGLLTEAKARFFYSKGIKEVNNDYQGLIVNNVLINVVSRVRAREELLFEVGVDNLTDDDGDMFFKVTRMYDGSLVAKAVINFVNYDYRLNQIIPLNAQLKEALFQRPFEL